MAAANTASWTEDFADRVSITSSIRIKTGISDVSPGKEKRKCKPEISDVLVSSLCCSLVCRSFVSVLVLFSSFVVLFFQDVFSSNLVLSPL